MPGVFAMSKKLHGRWSCYYSHSPQKRSNVDFWTRVSLNVLTPASYSSL